MQCSVFFIIWVICHPYFMYMEYISYNMTNQNHILDGIFNWQGRVSWRTSDRTIARIFFSMSWAVHALSFLFCLTQKGSVCKQLLCSFISWLFLIAKSKSLWWSQIWNRQRSIGCGDHTMDIRGQRSSSDISRGEKNRFACMYVHAPSCTCAIYGDISNEDFAVLKVILGNQKKAPHSEISPYMYPGGVQVNPIPLSV